MSQSSKKRRGGNVEVIPTGKERGAMMGCDGVQFFVDQVLTFGFGGQDYVRTVHADNTVELDLGGGICIEILCHAEK